MYQNTQSPQCLASIKPSAPFDYPIESHCRDGGLTRITWRTPICRAQPRRNTSTLNGGA